MYADVSPPTTTAPRRVVQPLDQAIYRVRQPVKGILAGPMRFNEEGVLLSALDTLVDGDMPAFAHDASIGVKPSMRFVVSLLSRASQDGVLF